MLDLRNDEPPPEFSQMDRLLGYETLLRADNWSEWIHRRVESISWESAHAIRHQISIDLRLIPAYFAEARFQAAGDHIHYVPLTWLGKQHLLAFDLRDEVGAALPLMTRHRSARIVTSILLAFAQTSIAVRLRLRPQSRAARPDQILLPRELEEHFWELVYPFDGERCVRALRSFRSGGRFTPLECWDWTRRRGSWVCDSAPPEYWRAALVQDRQFMKLAGDCARTFLLCVPLADEMNRRRIIKLAYSSYTELDDGGGVTSVVKGFAGKARLASRWNSAEDRLEGLPRPGPEGVEWQPASPFQRRERHTLRQAARRVLAAIGISTRPFTLAAPGIAHAASCHIQFTTPYGIQIRQAQLTIRGPDRSDRTKLTAIRGARTLGRVDLYVRGAKPGQTGLVELRLKPWATLIVRGVALATLVVVAMLVAAMQYAPQLRSGSAIAGAAAVLVVVPSILAAYAAREVGHPLCFDMLFGLRLAAGLPVIGSLVMAGLVLLGHPRSVLAYSDTIGMAAIAAFLCLTWRLADRGIPHASVTDSLAPADP